jgi:hypothetical protein
LHVDHQQGRATGVQLLKPVELASPGKHPINDMTADTDLMHIEELRSGRLCGEQILAESQPCLWAPVQP